MGSVLSQYFETKKMYTHSTNVLVKMNSLWICFNLLEEPSEKKNKKKCEILSLLAKHRNEANNWKKGFF